MFPRAKKRIKDGKVHRYWSIVESYRIDEERVLQRQVLYLGEINDSQHAAWCRAIDVLHEGSDTPEPLALFRVLPATLRSLPVVVGRYGSRIGGTPAPGRWRRGGPVRVGV